MLKNSLIPSSLHPQLHCQQVRPPHLGEQVQATSPCRIEMESLAQVFKIDLKPSLRLYKIVYNEYNRPTVGLQFNEFQKSASHFSTSPRPDRAPGFPYSATIRYSSLQSVTPPQSVTLRYNPLQFATSPGQSAPGGKSLPLEETLITIIIDIYEYNHSGPARLVNVMNRPTRNAPPPLPSARSDGRSPAGGRRTPPPSPLPPSTHGSKIIKHDA